MEQQKELGPQALDITCTFTIGGKVVNRMLHVFVKNEEQREQYNAVLHPVLPQ